MQPQSGLAGKLCPRCGKPWPLDAQTCVCGHIFRTQFAQPSSLHQTQAIPAVQFPQIRHRKGNVKTIGIAAFLVLVGLFVVAHTLRLDRHDVDTLAAKVHRGMSQIDVLDTLKQPSSKIDSGGYGNRWVYDASNGELRIDFVEGALETVRAFHYVSESAWNRAKPGMNRDELLDVLGKPDYANNFATIGMTSTRASSEELYFGDGEVRLKNGTVEDICPKGCGQDDKRWLYQNGGYNSR